MDNCDGSRRGAAQGRGIGTGVSTRVGKRAKGQAEEKWTRTHEHLLLFINSKLQLLHEQMMIINEGGGPQSVPGCYG